MYRSVGGESFTKISMEVDLDPPVFVAVTTYVALATGTPGIPEILHVLADS